MNYGEEDYLLDSIEQIKKRGNKKAIGGITGRTKPVVII